jgi:hypothetical protein
MRRSQPHDADLVCLVAAQRVVAGLALAVVEADVTASDRSRKWRRARAWRMQGSRPSAPKSSRVPRSAVGHVFGEARRGQQSAPRHALRSREPSHRASRPIHEGCAFGSAGSFAHAYENRMAKLRRVNRRRLCGSPKMPLCARGVRNLRSATRQAPFGEGRGWSHAIDAVSRSVFFRHFREGWPVSAP